MARDEDTHIDNHRHHFSALEQTEISETERGTPTTPAIQGQHADIRELADTLGPVQHKIKTPIFNGKKDSRKFSTLIWEVKHNNR